METETKATMADEKEQRILGSSMSKEEAGIVDEHFDHVGERAYGMFPRPESVA
jgi:hypothetical protein